MQEINALPWNGFKVASTFSGAGGSCLGYRMAGFKVVWANEFVPIAQESYKANSTYDSVLDTRDIRTIKPDEILSVLQLKAGELDLFDGSPPCQAFSTAGKREKGWGKPKSYEHGASQCNEQLFDEYIRILRRLQPKTFVAENVTGLVKGTAKGYFLKILADLKAAGYKVRAAALNASWLGVPQARERIVYIGVRRDMSSQPVFPVPLPYQYTVRDALPDLLPTDRVIHDTRGQFSNGDITDKPCCTFTLTNHFYVQRGNERRKLTVSEGKALCGFPGDFILVGNPSQQWERLGNCVAPPMMKSVAVTIRDSILKPVAVAA
jgi:DNA (cytosine-5)-methyltransferase 1